jgi:cytochrome c
VQLIIWLQEFCLFQKNPLFLLALLVIGIGKISNSLFNVEKPEVSGYKVEVTEDVAKKSVAQKDEKVEVDISALMAQADLAHGEKVFKKCSACHSIQAGGGNKIGPALYNVVGRKVADVEDYKYSKALVGYEKSWTFEELNGYLIKPAKWIKGTKMAFAGLRKEKDRASVIKYLNQNSDSPLSLP